MNIHSLNAPFNPDFAVAIYLVPVEKVLIKAPAEKKRLTILCNKG